MFFEEAEVLDPPPIERETEAGLSVLGADEEGRETDLPPIERETAFAGGALESGRVRVKGEEEEGAAAGAGLRAGGAC